MNKFNFYFLLLLFRPQVPLLMLCMYIVHCTYTVQYCYYDVVTSNKLSIVDSFLGTSTTCTVHCTLYSTATMTQLPQTSSLQWIVSLVQALHVQYTVHCTLYSTVTMTQLPQTSSLWWKVSLVQGLHVLYCRCYQNHQDQKISKKIVI